MTLARLVALPILGLAMLSPPPSPAAEPGAPAAPVAASRPEGPSPQAEAAAAAAGAWLALVDAGKYAESWTAAAGLFQGSVSQEAWVHALQGGRGPLGALLRRALTGKELRRTLPGGPDGEYAVLTFRASFKAKADAVETVTFALEKDGHWRASGYYIR